MNMLEELRRRGYSTKLGGTWYLIQSAEMARNSGRMLMGKEMYPDIAKAAGTSPAAIEKAIRETIHRAEPGRTNLEVIRELSYGLGRHED